VAESRLGSPQVQKRAGQSQHCIMRFLGPFLPAQATGKEGGRVLGIGNSIPGLGIREGGEMPELAAATFRHLPAQLFMMIGEEKEWAAGSPFLPHEQHRGLRTAKEQGRGGPICRRLDLMMEALAESTVSHLIMVL